MKYFNILFITFFLLFTAIDPGYAEHLVGGVLTYNCLGNGTVANSKNYRFKLNLKRDCKQGNTFDANVDIGIYQFNGTQYFFNRKINVPIRTERTVPLNQQSCIALLYGVCVDEAIYQFDVFNLPVINENYLIAFQRCCRNMTISNILDPGKTGITIMLEITPEAQLICNQGPTSDVLPPLVVCANEDLKLDLGAKDSEGDLLMYELCAPLTGGGPVGLGGIGDAFSCNGINPDPSKCVPALKDVTFANSSINGTNPFPSSTPISLTNGILSARPNSLGQYIFGVCIKEFRNGVLLTTSRRDIQINIAQCNITIQASIQADHIACKVAEITVCDPKNPYKIINQSKDTQYIKSVYWEFIEPKGTKITDTTYNFTRFFDDTGLYVGKMILNKGFQCSDSIAINLRSTMVATNKDQQTVKYQTATNFNVLANDNIPGSISVMVTIGNGTNGEINMFSQSSGKGTYTAHKGFSGKEILNYKVCPVSCPDACSSSTIEFDVEPPCNNKTNLVLPNVIFPEGSSGDNRYFIVEALNKCPEAFGPKPSKLSVYNRWGDLVYISTDYKNNWAGTNTQGQPLPGGTYYYLLDLGSVNAPLKGYVVIMR